MKSNVRRFAPRARRMGAVFAFALLASACGDDSTGPRGLTPSEVGDRYQVCSLGFDPAGEFLRSVDLLKVVDPAPASTFLQISNARPQEFKLTYTRQGETLSRDIIGSYSLGRNTARLSSTGLSALLLPSTLTLDYQASPKQLTASQGQNATISKARYAELAGYTTNEERANLPEPVTGSIAGRFSTSGCQ